MGTVDKIIVFAKPAVPGEVKTRLVPPLTPDQAANLHLAAMDDVIAAAEQVVPGDVELQIAGLEEDLGFFRRRDPGRSLRVQLGGSLGERLANAFADVFQRGAMRALIVGSDHPTLPAKSMQEAFGRLGSADITFGPSRDGGYYLVGLHAEAWPDARAVFDDIPWSTPSVLDASLERASVCGLEVSLLPVWYDVDRPADLELLKRDAHPASATARFLQQLETDIP